MEEKETLKQANEFFFKGDFQNALKLYDEIIKNNLQHDVAFTNRGNALDKLGRKEEARASYETAIKISPKQAAAHYQLGAFLEKIGDASCVERYAESLDLDPKFQPAWFHLGAVLKAMGRLGTTSSPLKRIDEVLEPYEAVDGEYERYVRFLSQFPLLLTPKFSVAKQASLEWQTQDVPYESETRTALMGSEQAGIRITHYKHYEPRYGGQDEDKVTLQVLGLPSGFSLALECERAGLLPRRLKISICAPEEMAKFFVDVFCGLFAQNISTATLEGLVKAIRPAMQYGQWSIVEHNSKIIVRAWPQNSEALFGLGVVAAVNKDYANAFEYLTKAVAGDPNHFDALYNLAAVSQALNKHEEALKYLDQVHTIKPDLHEAHYLKGVSYKALLKNTEAIASFNDTIRTSPNPGGHFHYSGKDFTEKAKNCLKEL